MTLVERVAAGCLLRAGRISGPVVRQTLLRVLGDEKDAGTRRQSWTRNRRIPDRGTVPERDRGLV
jgi:hypothetical protein